MYDAYLQVFFNAVSKCVSKKCKCVSYLMPVKSQLLHNHSLFYNKRKSGTTGATGLIYLDNSTVMVILADKRNILLSIRSIVYKLHGFVL